MAVYKFYLDGIEIEEPEGFIGATFSKERHQKFGGFWGEIGLVEGVAEAQITFRDEYSVALIKKEYADNFLDSTLTFRFEDCTDASACNGLSYIIDFGDYQEDCCSVSVTFRANIGDTIRSRINVKYEIETDSLCDIPTKDLEGSVNYEIVNDLSVVETNNLPNHLIPITGITDVTSNEFNFQNDSTAKGIDLIGVLSWTAESWITSEDYEIQIVLLNADDSLVSVLDSETYTSNSGVEESKSFSLINFVMQPFQKLSLRVFGTNTTMDWKFTWSVSTGNSNGIIIRPHKSQEEFTTHDGITIKNALIQLVHKVSDGKLNFTSNFLYDCDDKWLTNGFNLKGIKRPLLLSLESVFDGLNPIDNIEMGIRGNSLYFDRKIKQDLKKTTLFGDYEVTMRTNSEQLYSKVSIGYKDWKSDTIFGNDEVCSSREYVTDYSFGSNELKLESTFIASHYLIEKVKRQKGKEKADDKYDDEIFIVCVVGSHPNYQAETVEGFSLIEGVIYPSNTINLRISPARNLFRHRNILSLSGNTNFTSGTGNYTAEHQQNYECFGENQLVKENQDFTDVPIEFYVSKMVALIDIPEVTISAYCNLKEIIFFEYCGKQRKGYLKKAELNIEKTPSMTLEVFVE